MKPSDATFDSAVIRIFRDNLVWREGGRLSVTSISEGWVKLHFRQEDLFDALVRLEREGVLLPFPVSECVVFALTPEGEKRITDVPHKPRTLISALGHALKNASGSRTGSKPGTSLDRRRSDLSERVAQTR